MADEKTTAPNLYGYADDDVKVSTMRFGLNSKVYLTRFEWIPNGGAEGAEQEAIDVVFSIGGTNKSYRMFPIVKAFLKGGGETTDPNSPEFKDLAMDFNARLTHILHCFYDDKEVIKKALNRPDWTGFKHFVTAAAALLPKDFATRPLDIFLQWQWSMDEEAGRSFLEIPKKMKYGKWLCKHQEGRWKEQRVKNPTDDVVKALWYIKVEEEQDKEGNDVPILDENGQQIEHPFFKNGWFMGHEFARQQKTDTGSSNGTGSGEASQAMNANATEAAKIPPPPVTQTW